MNMSESFVEKISQHLPLDISNTTNVANEEELEALECEIDAKATEIIGNFKNRVELELLPLLYRMKELLPHGQWGRWFERFRTRVQFQMSMKWVQRKFKELEDGWEVDPNKPKPLTPEQATAAKLLASAKEQFAKAAADGNEQAAVIIAEYEEAYAKAMADVEAVEVVAPNINVVAAELTRDIEKSANRVTKLTSVVEASQYLNPTITHMLIAALNNAAKGFTEASAMLSASLPEPGDGTKCHQRLVRERMAQLPEPDLEEKQRLAVDFTHASVREISYQQAEEIILENEWLGSMNASTKVSIGLFFGDFLAGAVCFGMTAGSRVDEICGSEHRGKVMTLVRGANKFWTPTNSASWFISRACDLMAAKGFHVIIAYADPAGAEIGTIYSALNFRYTGMTSPTLKYRTPDGKVHDSRQVHGLTRDRRNRGLVYKRSWKAQKQLMEQQGCVFFKGHPKHRFVYVAGSRKVKRELWKAMKLPTLPYPKRDSPE